MTRIMAKNRHRGDIRVSSARVRAKHCDRVRGVGEGEGEGEESQRK